MDGELLSNGEPSKPAPRKSLAEIFRQHLPYYLAIGMSADEYWNGSTYLVASYREAYEMRVKREEWARWRGGAYFFEALLQAAPVLRTNLGGGKVEPGKYPAEPWPVTEKEVKEREERIERENFERFKAKLEAESKRELQRRAELASKEVSEDA